MWTTEACQDCNGDGEVHIHLPAEGPIYNLRICGGCGGFKARCGRCNGCGLVDIEER